MFRARNLAANEAALKDFLSAVDILDITERICRVYGQEKAKLLQKGAVLGALDLLIAATSLAHDLVLLTADHDFERVENLDAIFFSG